MPVKDVNVCARAIFEDLLRLLDDIDLSGLRDLCSWHSCRLMPDPLLPISVGASWDGEQIFLSIGLDPASRAEAISHELVHALADEPRWEPLNYQLRAPHTDREAFIEAVATEVGKLFRLADALLHRRGRPPVAIISEREMRARFRAQIERLRRRRDILEGRRRAAEERLQAMRAQAAAFAAAFQMQCYSISPPDPAQAGRTAALVSDISQQITQIDTRLAKWG